MLKYNPSVDPDFVVELPEEIAKLNKKNRKDYEIKRYSDNALKSLYNNEVIDNLFDKNSEHYESIGVTKQSVIGEMDKFIGMFKDSNKYDKEHGKPLTDVDGNTIAYSMEGWRIENCAEVWAMRNAIFNGAKVDNIVLRTLDADGNFAELCKNCTQTFKEFIDTERYIRD